MKAKKRFWRMLRIVARLKFAGANDAAQVAFHERDAGAFHRDIRAGAHGDADIGCGESGRVVDAVAGHGDDASCCLKCLMISVFLSGKTSASNSSMPSLLRDGCGRALLSPVSITIRRPPSLQVAQSVGRGLLDRIGDCR